VSEEITPDLIAALVAYLEGDDRVRTLTQGRVFGDEIPSKESKNMARKCVVVSGGGGPTTIGDGYQEYGDQRIDVRCYGETPYEASRLQLAVYRALKHLRRCIYAGVLLHWAKRSGGPLRLREPDTSWPFRFESYQVLSAEVEVT
jgi:hypothetical protein